MKPPNGGECLGMCHFQISVVSYCRFWDRPSMITIRGFNLIPPFPDWSAGRMFLQSKTRLYTRHDVPPIFREPYIFTGKAYLVSLRTLIWNFQTKKNKTSASQTLYYIILTILCGWNLPQTFTKNKKYWTLSHIMYRKSYWISEIKKMFWWKNEQLVYFGAKLNFLFFPDLCTLKSLKMKCNPTNKQNYGLKS